MSEENDLRLMTHEVVCPYEVEDDVTFYVEYPEEVPVAIEKTCPGCARTFSIVYEKDEEDDQVNVDIQTHDDE